MVEATFIILDNSEHSRDREGFSQSSDAVSLLAGSITQSHPENTVGVMSMGGKAPRVLLTLTSDLGKVLNAVSEVEISGEAHISPALQIAQLALKHRQNKNGTARIVLFVGSPIRESKDDLVKLGKKLKKNNVGVDVVSFGSDAENQDILAAFVESVTSGNNSHLVNVPAGGVVMSDFLISTPLFMGEEGGNPFGGAGAGGGAFEFGVDPNLDPELAMVLRLSMEEERARQAAVAGGSGQPADEAGSGTAATPAGAAAPAVPGSDAMEMDDDYLLQQAIALSMQQDEAAAAGGSGGGAAQQATPAVAAPPAVTPAPQAVPQKAEAPVEEGMMDVEDEELRMALQLSMMEAQEYANKPEGGDKKEDKDKQ